MKLIPFIFVKVWMVARIASIGWIALIPAFAVGEASADIRSGPGGFRITNGFASVKLVNTGSVPLRFIRSSWELEGDRGTGVAQTGPNHVLEPGRSVDLVIVFTGSRLRQGERLRCEAAIEAVTPTSSSGQVGLTTETVSEHRKGKSGTETALVKYEANHCSGI